jgi:hypothetical protein
MCNHDIIYSSWCKFFFVGTSGGPTNCYMLLLSNDEKRAVCINRGSLLAVANAKSNVITLELLDSEKFDASDDIS